MRDKGYEVKDTNLSHPLMPLLIPESLVEIGPVVSDVTDNKHRPKLHYY